MRRSLLLLVAPASILPMLAVIARPAPDNALAAGSARLIQARQVAAQAQARAEALDVAAAGERDGMRRAAAEEAAVAARVQAAEAGLVAADLRVAMLGEMLAAQRTRLAAGQAPLARLIGALQSFGRRPTVVALLEPGSVDDLVHLRAVLGTIEPVVAARTAAVRAGLDQARRLHADAALAATSLADGRARLGDLRLQLAQLQAAHRLSTGTALVESEQAIALGERARDIAGTLSAGSDATETRLQLEGTDPPLPRPANARGDDHAAAPVWSHAAPPYRLPVAGRLVTGLGELSDSGVRSRGLTFQVMPNAPVIAPTTGRVAFAGPYRDYGRVVIIDHGDGWTTLLSGLGSLTVEAGAHVEQGSRIGAAGTADPRVTVELRRRGRTIDLTALAG